MKEGRRLPGTLYLFPRDIPAFLAALTEVSAAIGVEIPTDVPDRAGLDRQLTTPGPCTRRPAQTGRDRIISL